MITLEINKKRKKHHTNKLTNKYQTKNNRHITVLRSKLLRSRSQHLLQNLAAKLNIEILRWYIVRVLNEAIVNGRLRLGHQILPIGYTEILIDQAFQSSPHDRSIDLKIILCNRFIHNGKKALIVLNLRRSKQVWAERWQFSCN